MSTGTGIMISDSLLLTNYHVIKKVYESSVWWKKLIINDQIIESAKCKKCVKSDLTNRIVHVDPLRDLALIELDHTHQAFVDPSDQPMTWVTVFQRLVDVWSTQCFNFP